MMYEKGRYVALQIQSRTTELVTRIHEVDGLGPDTEVVFVGKAPYSFLDTAGFYEYAYSNYGVMGIDNAKEIMYSPELVTSYMQNILGYNLNYQFYDRCNSINDNKEKYERELKEMPIYPYVGSIKKCDDLVLVKLSEDY